VACVVLSGGKRYVLQEFNCFVVNWLLGVRCIWMAWDSIRDPIC
jgi:hypothetical protein